jgi:hypothetical protein
MSAEALNGEKIHFTGDAYAMAAEAANGLNLGVTPSHLRCTGAVGAAILGERIYDSLDCKEALRPAALMPVYLRKPQAQREYEERMAAMADANNK